MVRLIRISEVEDVGDAASGSESSIRESACEELSSE